MEYGIMKDKKIVSKSWSIDLIIEIYYRDYFNVNNCYIVEIENNNPSIST